MDLPKKIPIFFETSFTYNYWNYFESGQIFLENNNPTFLEQSDNRILQKLGISSGVNAKTEMFFGYFGTRNKYSPTDKFSSGDILDQTDFIGFVTGINYESNRLNRKQYASKGSTFTVGLTYFEGYENYQPGNILKNEPSYSTLNASEIFRRWYKFKISSEKYYPIKEKYIFGYFLETVYSNRSNFSNFKSNLIHTPAFYPLQDSKTLFLENLRADKYAALGIKNVINFRKNLDFRLEGYIFQPYKEVVKIGSQQSKFRNSFSEQRFIFSGNAVYHSPVGPISLNFNYYDDRAKRFGVFFHIGFLMYNKRAIDL